MLKFIKCLTVLIAVFVTIFPNISRADISTGLVGHWTFDEGSGISAIDSSGNNNTGTLINGPSWTSGKVGSGALQFDGVDDNLNIGSASSLNLSNNYSINFWIYPQSGFVGTIIRQASNVSNSTIHTKYEIRVTSTGVGFRTGNGTIGDNDDDFNVTIDPNKWTMITCTLSSSNLKSCYKNGSLITTAPNDVDTSLITPIVGLIGSNRNTAGNNFYEGTLDDLRVYGRELSLSDISELYSAGNTEIINTPTPVPTPTPTFIPTLTPTPTPTPAPTIVVDVPNGSCSSVYQYGITWIFDKAYVCGQFANGDPWVLGPIIITRITPDFDGSKNGWEVNPASGGINSNMKQGFDSATISFDPTLVPALPYTAQPGQSIVKSTRATCYPNCIGTAAVLQTAAVLTVLGSVPPNNGSTVFRPPYVGTYKPMYSVNSLQTQLIPSLNPVSGVPTLDTVYTSFKRVQLDHFYPKSTSWRYLHPIENMPDYGGDIGTRNSNILRLFLNDSMQAKMPLLIAYTQYGIDLLYMVELGQTWSIGGSGHKPGMILPLAFAGFILNDSQLKSIVAKVKTFTQIDENISTYENPYGNVLFGNNEDLTVYDERNYWDTVITKEGLKTRKDPYEYIDGGYSPGTAYQAIITPTFRSEVLAFDLIPGLKDIWFNDDLFEYVHRSMNVGTWSQPDPCAPYDGVASNYGKTFGPDGLGSCIRDTNPSDGIGRFPSRHGLAFYASAYRNTFQDSMWSTYSVAQNLPTPTPAPTPIPSLPDTTSPTISITSPNNNTTISNTVTLSSVAQDPTIQGQTTSGILTVQFKLDNLNLGQPLTTAPYSGTWNTIGVTNGSHTLTAVATDVAGNTKTSNPITITISNTTPSTPTPTPTSTPTPANPSVPTPTPLNPTPTPSTPVTGGGTTGGGSPAGGGGSSSSGGSSPLGTFTPTVPQKPLTGGGNCTQTPAYTRTLTLGSTGTDVRNLQIFLNSKGFTVSQTGPGSKGQESTYFGPATTKALAKFQQANNILPATGYLNTTTLTKVNSLSTPVCIINSYTIAGLTTTTYTPAKTTFTRSLSLGSTGTDVKYLQIFLNDNGFTVTSTGIGSKGNESTYFGPATYKALIKYQEYYAKDILAPYGLAKGTGYFGPSTMRWVNGGQR